MVVISIYGVGGKMTTSLDQAKDWCGGELTAAKMDWIKGIDQLTLEQLETLEDSFGQNICMTGADLRAVQAAKVEAQSKV